MIWQTLLGYKLPQETKEFNLFATKVSHLRSHPGVHNKVFRSDGNLYQSFYLVEFYLPIERRYSAFKTAIVIKRLPKTRSGKILRGTVKKIADGETYKMPATIDDPAILDEIKEDLKKHNILK